MIGPALAAAVGKESATKASANLVTTVYLWFTLADHRGNVTCARRCSRFAKLEMLSVGPYRSLYDGKAAAQRHHD